MIKVDEQQTSENFNLTNMLIKRCTLSKKEAQINVTITSTENKNLTLKKTNHFI